MALIKSLALHCTTGSSDKVYYLNVVHDGSTYHVSTAYGRRTGSLKLSSDAVSSEAAAISTLVQTAAEKKKKGYVEIPAESFHSIKDQVSSALHKYLGKTTAAAPAKKAKEEATPMASTEFI